MRKQKTLLVILAIIISNLISISVTYRFKECSPNISDLDYGKFNSSSNYFIKKINEEYSKVYTSKPTLTVYPGYAELNKFWEKTVYNAIDDDLTFLKQKSIYILNQEENIATKVVFSYNPELKNKSYLSVNRIFSNPIDCEDIDVNLSSVFSNSITTNGLFIQITTISAGEVNINRKFEEKMIEMNTEIISKIQKYILDAEKDSSLLNL